METLQTLYHNGLQLNVLDSDSQEGRDKIKSAVFS